MPTWSSRSFLTLRPPSFLPLELASRKPLEAPPPGVFPLGLHHSHARWRPTNSHRCRRPTGACLLSRWWPRHIGRKSDRCTLSPRFSSGADASARRSREASEWSCSLPRRIEIGPELAPRDAGDPRYLDHPLGGDLAPLVDRARGQVEGLGQGTHAPSLLGKIFSKPIHGHRYSIAQKIRQGACIIL